MWPTKWGQHDGDRVKLTEQLAQTVELPYTLLTKNEAIESRSWDGKTFVETKDYDKKVRATLIKNVGKFLIIVDYHC